MKLAWMDTRPCSEALKVEVGVDMAGPWEILFPGNFRKILQEEEEDGVKYQTTCIFC